MLDGLRVRFAMGRIADPISKREKRGKVFARNKKEKDNKQTHNDWNTITHTLTL